MGMCAKSLTNGMNVAAPRTKRHGNRYSKADKMKASKTNDVSRRSSKKIESFEGCVTVDKMTDVQKAPEHDAV